MPPFLLTMDIDVDWCLTCSKRIQGSSPYCSPHCQDLAGPSIQPPYYYQEEEDNATPTPHHSQWTNDSTGISAWAAEIPSGAPEGGISSPCDDSPSFYSLSGGTYGQPPPSLSVATPPPLPSSDIEDTPEQRIATSLAPSACMFEQAREVCISGGEFYNAAGSMSIDASHDNSTSITHLWQYQHVSNQVMIPANVGEQLNCQTQGSENGDDLSCDTRCWLGDREGGMAHEEEAGEGGRNNSMSGSSLETECLDSLIDRLSKQEESDEEVEKQPRHAIQSGITTSSTNEIPTDEVIFNVLSSYPLPPTGNLRSFKCILKALLFSFSPLSLMMIAALLGLEDAQYVKWILLPAHPLIFLPKLEDNKEDNGNRTPVQFIDSSIADFFLDRTRSGQHYIDAPSAHGLLLEGCTSVMEKVWGEGLILDKVGSGWRDAYEYACQNWEQHRRAATRSKL
ncbi:hypothetical protein BDZ97DRAFT_1829978 [Flammula alnicola]|nr:hypothetical protein BDZ97DRAFT_1829978 [Flammula alnicola]